MSDIIDQYNKQLIEIERLRAERLHWEHQNRLLEAEIERLKAELRQIEDQRYENISWAKVDE